MIDKALLGGDTDVEIGRQFGLHRTTIARHRRHIAEQISSALERRDAKLGSKHLDQILDSLDAGDTWLHEAVEALRLSDSEGRRLLSPEGALSIPKFVKELRGNGELRARLYGLLKSADHQGDSSHVLIVVPPPAPVGMPADLSIPGVQDSRGRLLPNRDTSAATRDSQGGERVWGDASRGAHDQTHVLDADFEDLPDEG